MPNLAQELISYAERGQMLSAMQVSRFSPSEIRLAIQTLMAEDRDALAYALGDAGLALHPDSEDIVAITSLLAVMREDWPQAVDLLRQLMEMQGGQATVFTHAMLIRSLRCDLELAAAFDAAREGLARFPDHPELLKEYDALAATLGLGTNPSATTPLSASICASSSPASTAALRSCRLVIRQSLPHPRCRGDFTGNTS